MIRYVLYPGYVISRYDSQQHYIGARDLARLYGVPMSMCLIFEGQKGWQDPPGTTALYPQDDGDYSLEHKP